MRTDNASVTLRAVTRASLTLTGGISEPAGARDDTVSFGQEFTYRALIQKGGNAGLTGPGEVVLQAEQGISVLSAGGSSWGSSATRNFDFAGSDTATVLFSLIAEENPQVARILSKLRQLQVQKTNTQQSIASADEGVAPTSAFVAASGGDIQNQINSLNNQLANILQTSVLTVEITQAPNDEFTGLPAFIAQGTVQTVVTVMEEAHFEIEAIQVRNRVSSSQTFTVVTTVIDTSGQISEQRNASLEITGGTASNFVIPEPQKTFTDTSVSWQITAPSFEQLSVPEDVTLRIVSWANDVNSGAVLRDTAETVLTVERQAVLSMDAVALNLDETMHQGPFSFSQRFKVKAMVSNLGDAAIGSGGILRINLNPADSIRLISNSEQPLNGANEALWELETPSRIIASNIRISFVQRPNDLNTQQPASLDPESGTASIAISTQSYNLQVRGLEEFFQDSTIISRKGSNNIGLLGFEVNNPGSPGSAPGIRVDSLLLQVLDNSNNPLEASLVLSRIIIANYAEYASRRSLAKLGDPPAVFADTTAPATIEPFNLNLSNSMVIEPGEVDTFVVMVNLAQQAPNRSFRLRVARISAVEMSGNNPVEVVDNLGNVFNANGASSQFTTIIPDNPDEIFGNYPNPFTEEHGYTSFVFWAEDAGTAEIQIYTLMGGLVWSKKADINIGQQLYDGKIRWDGTNNAGNRVLNGVYITILKLNYNNGQSRTFKTKVAYIK